MQRPLMAFGLALLLLPACGGANPPDRSVMPEMRPASMTPAQRSASFQRWIEAFRPRALSAGITPATFDQAFRQVSFLPDVIARDQRQAEFVRPIWEYLDGAVSDARIANGRAMLREHRATLDAIEARFGVEREVVVAVWGLESSFGRIRGTTPVIPAMATLAYEGRRRAFFETQLIGALRILQSGDTTPERMVGSWAGAMGHTQFIPTSYLAYAVDFTGDGRRDIWSDDPSDALASAANYLARHGWTRGQPWGVEVALPQGFDASATGQRRSVAQWRAAGLRLVGGGAIPDHGEATLMFPAGVRGPALLTFDNFRVIKRYNNADAYAIAIGHLADRLRGQGDFRTPWPRGDRPLSADERMELQRLLTARGHDTGGVDGRIGPNTLAAVQAWQARAGLTPDGYVSFELLQRLRR
ncbi:lytic murein transglycosylase [Rhodobaculum claviforme]|uniref:Murein transglycosylase n=1 Tax=Rhodobaculum claviforme TaxID=1549854 RepID=A0A934TKW4_9RHOB|nr:lytic murein transglycosylase [Rhodobaculum claviforme]MBK5927697.1 murein transglycosylase [Rhodobaculum claviforme]